MKAFGAFHRAHAMMAAISAILASSTGVVAQAAINRLGPYESRGHGLNRYRGRKPNRNKSTPWFTGSRHVSQAAHGGGAREVARRQRQLASGTLRTN